MVRVPHHDPEHGGSIFLTTLSLSMGRRVRAVSLPFESLRAVSLSNRSNRRPINVGSGLNAFGIEVANTVDVVDVGYSSCDYYALARFPGACPLGDGALDSVSGCVAYPSFLL